MTSSSSSSDHWWSYPLTSSVTPSTIVDTTSTSSTSSIQDNNNNRNTPTSPTPSIPPSQSQSSPSLSPSHPSVISVCLVLPYKIKENNEAAVEETMLRHWLNHYLNLGMQLFIYDRDGMHHHVLIPYMQPTSAASSSSPPKVVYYPYTVHGYLFDKTKPKERKKEKPTRRQQRHHRNSLNRTTVDIINNRLTELRMNHHLVGRGNDKHYEQFKSREKQQQQSYSSSFNHIPAEKHHIHYTDNDKTDTLTWCRFDARTQYGSTDVLVVDYDEFLYCPRTKATYRAQVQYNRP
jgi:uncharacterized C2H2 Zn-finger protein